MQKLQINYLEKNIQVKITSKESLHGRNIKVSIPHVKQDIPLFVMFKVLGVTNDFDITNFILYNVPDEQWREYKSNNVYTFDVCL